MSDTTLETYKGTGVMESAETTEAIIQLSQLAEIKKMAAQMVEVGGDIGFRAAYKTNGVLPLEFSTLAADEYRRRRRTEGQDPLIKGRLTIGSWGRAVMMAADEIVKRMEEDDE